MGKLAAVGRANCRDSGAIAMLYGAANQDHCVTLTHKSCTTFGFSPDFGKIQIQFSALTGNRYLGGVNDRVD
jgi:hypothetical protein